MKHYLTLKNVLVVTFGLLVVAIIAFGITRYVQIEVEKQTTTYFSEHKADFVGPQGPQGPAGANGADGKNGANGTNGANGKAGSDGKSGQDGCTWLGWGSYGQDLGFAC